MIVGTIIIHRYMTEDGDIGTSIRTEPEDMDLTEVLGVAVHALLDLFLEEKS